VVQGGAPFENELVHSKAQLSETTGGSHYEYSEYHVLQQNVQNLASPNMTVSDGVSPSSEGGGAQPPSKSATARHA